MLEFKKESLFSDGTNYKCSVVIVYQRKSLVNQVLITKKSAEFDTNPPQTESSKKRSILVWVIPVTLAVIALVLGLLLMAYKYRLFQNNFHSFARRGGYRRQMDDYGGDGDDNMGVAFHAGIDLH